jgi:hypothetical protein
MRQHGDPTFAIILATEGLRRTGRSSWCRSGGSTCPHEYINTCPHMVVWVYSHTDLSTCGYKAIGILRPVDI